MACCFAFAVVFGGLITAWRKLRGQSGLATGFAPVAHRIVRDDATGTVPTLEWKIERKALPRATLVVPGTAKELMYTWGLVGLLLVTTSIFYATWHEGTHPVDAPSFSALQAEPGSATWCAVICSSICPKSR